MFDCVCNGSPVSLKVEMLTLVERATGDTALVNPETVHTTDTIVDKEDDAVRNVSNRTPDDGTKTTDTEKEWLFLEQEEAAK